MKDREEGYQGTGKRNIRERGRGISGNGEEESGNRGGEDRGWRRGKS